MREVAAWSRSPFRWAGSKKSLLPSLVRSCPDEFNTYVEPFAGSACLFFAIGPVKAILGDFNDELMHAYRVLARHPRLLARAVAALPVTSETYYATRSVAPDQLDDFDRAVRFLYLNRNSFNGVYRTNRDGQFNVPMGRRTGRPPTESELYRCAYALRDATILCGDFESTISHAGTGDFVYADPPYSTTGRSNYGEYGYGAFSHNDLPRLIGALEDAANRGARVLFSYRDDPSIIAKLGDWNVQVLTVRRRVAGGNAHRSVANEILASPDVDFGRASDKVGANATPAIGEVKLSEQ